MRFQFLLIMVFCGGGLLAGCAADGPHQDLPDGLGKDLPDHPDLPGSLSEDRIEVTLDSTDPACRNQRATVPRSLAISDRVDGASSTVERHTDASYVAYQVARDDLFAYFSFAPDLPAHPTTELVRSKLAYAYVTFRDRQPAVLGGSLTLLSGNDLLSLADFARLEVVDGQLQWRLVRQSADHYDKVLSIYDQDPSNDPQPRDDCKSDDIAGLCACEFTGPVVSVTLEGAFPL